MANVLITGTSSGIGLATTLECARAGHNVLATMRNTARATLLREQAGSEGLIISILPMDVNSDESVSECFAGIAGTGMQIDVLINNAGVERHGSIEELPMQAFRDTMETNYFGAVRCIRAVVPQMRKRGSGCIINVTSVAGKISSSPLGPYAASKFALEALSEALAQEMKRFGVRVAMVQPGIIDTAMAHAVENPVVSASPHARQLAALFTASLAHPTPPSVVATVIRGIIESGTTKLRHPAGPDAAPFLAWRAGMTDEEWTTFNSLDDEAFTQRVKTDFGLDVKLKS